MRLSRLKASLLIVAVAAPAAASVQSAPDAHTIRRERGDIIEFDKGVRIYPGDPRASYVAPYRGWKYRPVRAGERLRAPFYRPSYVIAEPGRYGLAVARGERRWIRYGDDILLVDIQAGRVLKVLPGRYR